MTEGYYEPYLHLLYICWSYESSLGKVLTLFTLLFRLEIHINRATLYVKMNGLSI